MIIGISSESSALSGIFGVLYAIFVFATLVPSIAVTVRRLHDINKSGWYILISFIPLIGAIILLVWECTAGDHGPNEYGPDPKNPYVEDIETIGSQDL